MAARFGIVIGFFALGYGLLLFRLYDVQVSNYAEYRVEAASRYANAEFLEPKRGTIYFTDKNGLYVAAALNKELPYVYAVPSKTVDPGEAATFLQKALGQSHDEIYKKLSKSGDPYEPLAFKVSEQTATEIRNKDIEGIYVGTTYERIYPFGKLAAHLIGYVGPAHDGPEKQGQYGLEKFYNDIFIGVPGSVRDGEIIPAVPGDDVYLTIDPTIQSEAERILDEVIETHHAHGGGVIVQDPKSGKILAMAGRPTFNPNEYKNYSVHTFLNPLLQEVYEPGSVFKVLTMAAGIDSGAITPETTYEDVGEVTLNGRTIKNWDGKAHGKITMTEVLEQSVNTGAVFAGRKTGRETFREYLVRFGLEDTTDFDSSGELPGNITRLNAKEPDIVFATASYGQGVAITPLQLINAISAIANDGVRMRPYVNARLGPKKIETVLTKKTADTVTDMMISAVDKAKVARIAGYSVAGKTGTAFVPDFTYGGYTENVINTYTGFAPTSNPRFTILIRINEPEGNPVAALTVVPAFRDLAQFILNYYEVTPDRIPGNTRIKK